MQSIKIHREKETRISKHFKWSEGLWLCTKEAEPPLHRRFKIRPSYHGYFWSSLRLMRSSPRAVSARKSWECVSHPFPGASLLCGLRKEGMKRDGEGPGLSSRQALGFSTRAPGPCALSSPVAAPGSSARLHASLERRPGCQACSQY